MNLFQNLDKAFENKIRLGTMSILLVNTKVTFNYLKEALDVTDGNLASHVKTLEKSGYIKVYKSFSQRKPKTTYEITEKGREAFEKHLSALEEILKQR